MKTAKAEITAVVQCPECGDRIDVTDTYVPLMKVLTDVQFTCGCPECSKQFKIEGIK